MNCHINELGKSIIHVENCESPISMDAMFSDVTD